MLIRPCERGVPYIHVELVIAVELKDAFSRSGAEEGEVPRFRVARVLQAVEAPPDVREAERADQPLREVVAFDGSQRGIGGGVFDVAAGIETAAPPARGRVVARVPLTNVILFSYLPLGP